MVAVEVEDPQVFLASQVGGNRFERDPVELLDPLERDLVRDELGDAFVLQLPDQPLVADTRVAFVMDVTPVG